MRWCWFKPDWVDPQAGAAGSSAVPSTTLPTEPEPSRTLWTSKLATSSTHVIASSFKRKKATSDAPVDVTAVEYDIMPIDTHPASKQQLGTGSGPACRALALGPEDSVGSDIFLPGLPQPCPKEQRATIRAAAHLHMPAAAATSAYSISRQGSTTSGLDSQQPGISASNLSKSVYWEEVFIVEGLSPDALPDGAATSSKSTAAGLPPRYDAAAGPEPINLAADCFLTLPAAGGGAASQPPASFPPAATAFESICRDEVYVPAVGQLLHRASPVSQASMAARFADQGHGKVASNVVYSNQVFIPATTAGKLSCTVSCSAPSGPSTGSRPTTPLHHHPGIDTQARLSSPVTPAAVLASIDLSRDDQGSECNSTATLHLAAYRHSTCTSEIHAPMHKRKDSEEVPLAAAVLVLGPDTVHASSAASPLPQASPMPPFQPDAMVAGGNKRTNSTPQSEYSQASGSQHSGALGPSQPDEVVTLTMMASDDLGRDARSQPPSRSASPHRGVVAKAANPAAGASPRMAGSVDTEPRLDAVQPLWA